MLGSVSRWWSGWVRARGRMRSGSPACRASSCESFLPAPRTVAGSSYCPSRADVGAAVAWDPRAALQRQGLCSEEAMSNCALTTANVSAIC
eukprot:6198734-Pleurochrysis_carterae.AAC.1